MSNTITPHVAPVRFEISGSNQELFTLHIDGDVLGIDVEDAWIAAAETMNLDAFTTHKRKQLTVYYDEATDVLDISDWALILADGVNVTFEITGNEPEENTMTTTPELLSPPPATTEHLVSISEPTQTEEFVCGAQLAPMQEAFPVTGTVNLEEIDSLSSDLIESREAAKTLAFTSDFAATLTTDEYLGRREQLIADNPELAEEHAEWNAAHSTLTSTDVVQTATYSPHTGLVTQSYFPPAVETQKDVSVGIVPNNGFKLTDCFSGKGAVCDEVNEKGSISDDALAALPKPEAAFNTEAALEAFNKKWNAQPLKTNKRGNAKPADAGQLSQLVREGVGSKAKKKAPLRQVVRSTEAAAHYLAAAIHDFQQPGEDGMDFINTSAIAETRLGKFLDINARVPFAYQNIGEFASVGAFWYFISAETPDDSLRSLHGTAARNARNRVKSRAVDGFRTLIADATWAKINSDPGLVMAMVENDLRFMCFYKQDNSPLIAQSPVSSWYMPVLEEIANTLREIAGTGNTDLVPDFSFLDAPRQPRGRRYN